MTADGDRPKHPLFSGLYERRPANFVDAIVDRRVDDARKAGLFDDLAGRGEPIADLDRHRRPGWFADRLASTEQAKIRAEGLELALNRAMPALWRLDSETAVRSRVAELNAPRVRHNRTAGSPLELLDVDATVVTWRRLRTR